MELNTDKKKALISLARESISSIYTNKEVDISNYKEFIEKLGVFVTLTINGELRGCIGYPRPYYPLNESIIKAAKAAAFEDTRFDPLTPEEFKKVKVEISILTKPELIKVKDYHEYIKKIKIGTDGLILEYGPNSGLLLPQVPREWGWDEKEFLENLCHKSGLGQDEWKEPGIKIYSFQAIIFKE
jgi:hypothetical protein